MGETDTSAGPAVQPLKMAYDQLTGVPSEYNELLPKDSDEYKRWKAAGSGEAAVAGEMAGLAVGDDGGAAPPAAEPAATEKSSKSSSKKKKDGPMVVLEKNTRNKKKSITVIAGLDLFGVKLGEASKIFGKKFASGCAVVKTAEGKEQIECQVRRIKV
jgi:density-regulated protein DRP1